MEFLEARLGVVYCKVNQKYVIRRLINSDGFLKI